MSNAALFLNMNAKLGQLISAKVASVFGTGQERELMTSITQSGIDAGNEFIGLIKAGLTYDIWKDFLVRTNAIEGTLGRFENEAGDMAALVKEYVETDLRDVYETFNNDGSFSVETVQADINTLKSRLVWAEEMWASVDSVKGVEATVIGDDVPASVEPVNAEVIIDQDSIDRRIENQ